MTVEFLKTQRVGGVLLSGLLKKKATVSTIALITALAAVQPAWATIDNTVTATGSSPGNTDDVTATADETVDVEDAAPALVVTKTSGDSNVGAGGTISYTYTVENTGNITLSNVSLSDAHDGAGGGVTPTLGGAPLTDNGTVGDSTDAGGDNVYDTLAPGDVVTWTSTYTVVQADINNNGGGDGDIDNTVTASATPAAGTLAGTLTASEAVTLEAQNASLLVTKVADDDTNVTVGQVITYTYTVTNNGNVPITDISLADSVTAGSGGNPTPILNDASLIDNGAVGDSTDDALDESYDTLGIGDVITFTGQYTVTQSDVDTLQ